MIELKWLSTILCVLSVAGLLPSSCSAPEGCPVVQSTHCVVVWSEGTAGKDVYPQDINGAVAEGLQPLKEKGWDIVTVNIDEPFQGLPDFLLNRADVLIWWGHERHADVKDALVQKIVHRVKEEGMGFIALHSAHFSKPNIALMGTACSWAAAISDAKTLRVTVNDSTHPIAKGVHDFSIAHDERYSEPYAVPEPQSVVFSGAYTLNNGGTADAPRVGMCWQIGQGRLFYFQAGHETNPVYYDENVRLILRNATEWAASK